ncbi:hypothetical protein QGM71_17330 [Virgibacillus sp. C22-A2]|uniref:Uncharacterized protein n=1 Tax=Virgibacillus tibetensis TaxID=3042313 RepID=A0ABU6KK41_9BACI|nr:hypothetical protein [Virgibacillus sp. C22-A2]
MTILWSVLADYYGRTLSLFLSILLLTIILASFRFKFTIHTDHLVYQIFLFNKSIIKKEIYPDQINQVKFIRVGWAKKAAIIKINKGINIRLAVLEPQKAYEHLIEYAEIHDITIFKSKDYLILERMK